MLFITSRMPTINTEPLPNKNFQFDLENNSPGRAFYCCKRTKKGSYSEIGSQGLLSELKESN